MRPQLQSEPIPYQQQTPEWSPALRIAFRFSVAYLGLFCAATQILTSLFSATQGDDIPDLGTLWPMRSLVVWTAGHIFHVAAPLSLEGNSASGDCMFGWVTAFCLLVIAAFVTIAWSIFDRRRQNYASLHKWIRLFFRFALAGQMINYGLAKVIPLQMPYPSLTRLLQPFGTFSPMGVLWSSIGAAPAYEMFAGWAEVIGGVLLVVPRTATLGALICLADMIQVFMLNMTYDVPVKLFAFHLILLSCFLLARDVPRLINVLFLDRDTTLRPRAQLFNSLRANRIALATQIVLGLWLLGLNFHAIRQYWTISGSGRPQSALYGIWDVTQMSVDGEPRPPLLTDNVRWRRVIFDYPRAATLQLMDDSLAYYGALIKLADNSLVLTKAADQNWRANLRFQRPAQNQLIVDGRMDNHQVHIELQLKDRHSFLLVSRGFHWIQEFPLNR